MDTDIVAHDPPADQPAKLPQGWGPPPDLPTQRLVRLIPAGAPEEQLRAAVAWLAEDPLGRTIRRDRSGVPGRPPRRRPRRYRAARRRATPERRAEVAALIDQIRRQWVTDRHTRVAASSRPPSEPPAPTSTAARQTHRRVPRRATTPRAHSSGDGAGDDGGGDGADGADGPGDPPLAPPAGAVTS